MNDNPVHDALLEPSNLWGLRHLVVSGDCRLGSGFLVDACQAADIGLTYASSLRPAKRSVAERFACAVQRELDARAKAGASGSETVSEYLSSLVGNDCSAHRVRRPPARAWRPLEVVEVESFLLDIQLLNREATRRIERRPWSTLLVDKSSETVFGHHVSFDPPSAAVVLAALAQNGLDLNASAVLCGLQSSDEQSPRVGARAGASSTPRSGPSRRPDVQDATEANAAHSPMRKRSEIST